VADVNSTSRQEPPEASHPTAPYTRSGNTDLVPPLAVRGAFDALNPNALGG